MAAAMEVCHCWSVLRNLDFRGWDPNSNPSIWALESQNSLISNNGTRRAAEVKEFQKLLLEQCLPYKKLNPKFGIFAAVLLAIRLRISIWATLERTLDSDKALVFFEEFHALLVFFDTILGAIIGMHFQALNVSPLEKHLGIILLFIMATIVYIIAYLVIKLQRQDAAYLFIFRLVCLISGILSVELLV